MQGKFLTAESVTTRVMNAVAAGQTDQDSTVLDMVAGGVGCTAVTFYALLGAVTDGSLLALEVYAADTSDGVTGRVKVGNTATVTAASASNKVLACEVVWPAKRYVFARVKRGTQNAAIDGVLAVRREPAVIGEGLSLADASVLAVARFKGPALDGLSGLPVPA